MTSSQPATTWLPDWQGHEYAANTGHHRTFDEWFLRNLPVGRSDRVLDVGCGSGDFTRTVAELVPEGHVFGFDAQPSMVDEARSRAADNQSFGVGPAQALCDTVGWGGPNVAPFDVVYSRAVLHWVPAAEHPGVLEQVHRVLRPGGWARIECGGGDNVTRLTDWLDPISATFGGPARPWAFLPAGTYLTWLEEAGFVVTPNDGGYVRTEAQHRSFDRTSFVGWLTSQCLSAYEAAMPTEHHEAFRAEALARVDEFALPDGTYDQTFVRLDCLVQKPS